MKKPYDGVYDNKEFCIREIMLARSIFGNRKTTEFQFDAMIKGLMLVMLHCPEEIKPIAQSTLLESTVRRTYYEKMWGNN